MPTVAYLANQFPSSVEPYVVEEIGELRRRGATVIAGSIRQEESGLRPESVDGTTSVLCFEPIQWIMLFKALGLMVTRWNQIGPFVKRALWQGKEPAARRFKALLHTWLGAYYALLLKRHGRIQHIHVHHGYFGSWVGMVAASLLDVGFSLTLHGSDLLIHRAYIDTKLDRCKFCVTISEHNRRHILENCPSARGHGIFVSRMGVDAERIRAPAYGRSRGKGRFNLLTAGRLHPVKNHAFLIAACAQLRDSGMDFECSIAGSGPERMRLENQIAKHQLQDRVKLLGHLPHAAMDSVYRSADLFVLTSLSEGIPLVLMEAMACGTAVLAPEITGIPELVTAGKSGFLYKAGSLQEFVRGIRFFERLMREDGRSGSRLSWIRHAAQVQVRRNFNRQENMGRFADMFLQLVVSKDRSLWR
jgi:glycosyltransferase involved in cell wall biosynthesis